MIVCSCFGTTDREIRAALGPNGSGFCPAGHGCGNCMQAVLDIAAKAQQTQQPALQRSEPPAENERRPRS